jgi:hypothetical protein
MNQNNNAPRKLVSILMILAIALAMPVAQAYAALEVMRRPTVYVKDANSYAAIQGASVNLDGVSVGTTDSSGGIVLANANVGQHQLSVGKGGYNTYQTAIDVKPSNSTFTVYLTTALSATLEYSTDFENVTTRDANRLYMGAMDNWFEFSGDGGATKWIEGVDRNSGITCHSGTRCIGLEVTDITKSGRSQFEARGTQSLVGDEFFVSVWLYLPSDFRLHSIESGAPWLELIDPIYHAGPTYLPYVGVYIRQPNVNVDSFNLQIGQRDEEGELHILNTISNFPLKRGQWFHLEWYVKVSDNGAVKVWMDGSLIFDVSGVDTYNAAEGWFTTVGKIYYDNSDTFSPYRLWVDDLEIWKAPAGVLPTNLT